MCKERKVQEVVNAIYNEGLKITGQKLFLNNNQSPRVFSKPFKNLWVAELEPAQHHNGSFHLYFNYRCLHG